MKPYQRRHLLARLDDLVRHWRLAVPSAAALSGYGHTAIRHDGLKILLVATRGYVEDTYTIDPDYFYLMKDVTPILAKGIRALWTK